MIPAELPDVAGSGYRAGQTHTIRNISIRAYSAYLNETNVNNFCLLLFD